MAGAASRAAMIGLASPRAMARNWRWLSRKLKSMGRRSPVGPKYSTSSSFSALASARITASPRRQESSSRNSRR